MIMKLEKQDQERSTQILSLQNQFDRFQSEFFVKEKEKESTITYLEKQLEKTYTRQVKEKESTITYLEKQLKDRNREILSFEKQLKERSRQIVSLRKQLNEKSNKK